MSTISPSTTAAASVKPGGSGACAGAGCAESSSSANAAWLDGCITVASHHRRSAPNAFDVLGGWRPYLANHGIPAHCETTPAARNAELCPSAIPISCVAAGTFASLGGCIGSDNGPENRHAPLHSSL